MFGLFDIFSAAAGSVRVNASGPDRNVVAGWQAENRLRQGQVS